MLACRRPRPRAVLVAQVLAVVGVAVGLELRKQQVEVLFTVHLRTHRRRTTHQRWSLRGAGATVPEPWGEESVQVGPVAALVVLLWDPVLRLVSLAATYHPLATACELPMRTACPTLPRALSGHPRVSPHPRLRQGQPQASSRPRAASQTRDTPSRHPRQRWFVARSSGVGQPEFLCRFNGRYHPSCCFHALSFTRRGMSIPGSRHLLSEHVKMTALSGAAGSLWAWSTRRTHRTSPLPTTRQLHSAAGSCTG